MTIVKSGTHLIFRFLGIAAGLGPSWFPSWGEFLFEPKRYLDPLNGLFVFAHCTPPYDEIFKTDKSEYYKILGIRDLRDVIVSYVDWIKSMKEYYSNYFPFSIDDFCEQDLDSQLENVLLYSSCELKVQTKSAIECMKNPTVFICRYEDLVGPKGGGDLNRQIETMIMLADHVRSPLSQEKITELLDQLYGAGHTFRKGQVGRWRTAFKRSHVELFKQVLGDELIQLGYEEDNEWGIPEEHIQLEPQI
ncbi:MAG: sulfotransferase domain-containing protein [Rhabdochlamydiaceae bacterium]|nr:sulfotransferase domain-containing protein [Rhabdochlamydiaceae bacterium]